MNNDYNQNYKTVPNTNPVTTEPNTTPIVPVVTSEPVVMPQPVTTPAVTSQPVVIPQPVTTPVVTSEPVVVPQPVTTPVVTSQPVNDKKEYTPPSKFKIVVLIIFFILLVGFVLFLPDISAYIEKYKSGNTSYTKEEITTGKLICTLNSNTTNLDKNYSWRFIFSENKLDSVRLELVTRGDATGDKEALSEIGQKCKTLEEETNSIDGVSVRCDIYDDRIIETQSFNLENIDNDKLDAAYSEAGGMNPGYKYNQDISIIEKNMNASGYSCKKEK